MKRFHAVWPDADEGDLMDEEFDFELLPPDKTEEGFFS